MSKVVHERTAVTPDRQFVLPVLVFGLPEVRRLARELEALEGFFQQAALRTPGKPVQLPKVSRLLEALAAENGCNLLVQAERRSLAAFLKAVGTEAPHVHISFASDPSAAFTAKIVRWFREQVHPALLLQVGLQPSIAAGCVVRTPNKQFDFSLRHRFDTQSLQLTRALEAAPAQPVAAAATAAVPEKESVT